MSVYLNKQSKTLFTSVSFLSLITSLVFNTRLVFSFNIVEYSLPTIIFEVFEMEYLVLLELITTL